MQKQTNNVERIRLKQVITVALLFMMIGTTMELYLLDHYEDTLQLIPLFCIGAALLVMLLLFFQRSRGLIIAFQLILGMTALSGIYGAYLHLRANYEFELEMRPTAKGWDLFVEAMSGALPSLAPASMMVLALIGYSYLLLIKQER